MVYLWHEFSKIYDRWSNVCLVIDVFCDINSSHVVVKDWWRASCMQQFISVGNKFLMNGMADSTKKNEGLVGETEIQQNLVAG